MNRKIIGASPKYYKGIHFRSTLEVSCYKKLEDSGLEFSYESERIVLWEGTKLKSTFLYAPKKIAPGKYGKNIEMQNSSLRNITYTPDFVVEKGDYKIYFDVKGKENDTYPLKKKVFLKELDCRDDGRKYMFFEPHNVRQMVQSIDIIKSL